MEIKFYGAFVLNRRVDLHAIDATPARWRGDAGSSPLDGMHPTHWLISTQVPTIVDVSMLLQPVNMVSEKVPPAADLALFDGGAAASSCRWAWRIILPLSPSRDSARG